MKRAYPISTIIIITVLSLVAASCSNNDLEVDFVTSSSSNSNEFEEYSTEFNEESTESLYDSPDNNSNAEFIDFSDKHYVAFGDSITWGRYPQYNGVVIEKSYPVLVGEEMNLNSVNNCAVSGSTIAYHEDLTNVNSQLSDAPDYADIVSVMIGVNDYTFMSSLGQLSDNDISTVYGGLNVLIRSLKNKYPNAFIFFITPYPCYNPSYGEVRQDEIVSAIKTVCDINNVPYLDLYSKGQFSLENDPYTDGVHPTQEFLREYTAPQIVNFIKNNYKEPYKNTGNVDFSKLSYAAIGDSITYGFCGDHSLPPFSNNYPNCVKNSLGMREVINLGACGCLLARHSNSTYTSMIDKIDLIPDGTDIISVLGGINDYCANVPLGDINSTDEYTIYGALNSIANKLTTNYKDSFIFFITPLPLAKSNLLEIDNTEYSVEDLCIAIKEVGAKWNIPVYDANNDANFNPETHSFDGCHPTEEYYTKILASEFSQFIKQNYSRFTRLTYIAFGDSITYGADYTRNYSQMDYPYPTLVSNILGFKSYSNFAISGSTVATGVDDLPSIYHQCLNASAGADIVSVLGGVNDYNRNVELGTISDNSTTTFYGSLKFTVELLLEKYPDAFIFLMTPYKEDCCHEYSCTEPNAAGYNLEDYAEAVKAVAELYKIPVLDMYNEGQYELEMYNLDSDGIHPSQEFIREYTAPQIAEFIRQNYRGK